MGRFIVIEGVDLLGKSTQLARAEDAARSRGLRVAVTSFPVRTAPVTGGPIERFLAGELPLVTNPETDPVGQMLAGQVLFSLNRREAAPELRDLIARHDLVLASRYTLSARAYAIAGGVNPAVITRVHRDLEGDLPRPDLTIVLDADTDVLAERPRTGGLDAFERDRELQRRVRTAYAALAVSDRRVELVDAAGTPDEVAARVVALLCEKGMLPG
jgi:dTMP kinase